MSRDTGLINPQLFISVSVQGKQSIVSAHQTDLKSYFPYYVGISLFEVIIFLHNLGLIQNIHL